MPVCILDLHSVSKKKKNKTKIRKKQPIFSFNRSFRDSFRAFLVWLLNNLYWTLLTSFTWEFLLILSGLLNWRRWTGIFSPKKPVLPGKRFVFDKHADIFTTVTCIPYLWTLVTDATYWMFFWMATGTMQRDPSFLSSELFWQGEGERRKLDILIKQIMKHYCAYPLIFFLSPNCVCIMKLSSLTSLIIQGKKEKVHNLYF